MDIILRTADIPPDLLEFFEPVRESNPMSNAWVLSPDPYPMAHFATFPREVPRRCIAAGTSERGACPTCGSPWRRVTERGELKHTGASGNKRPQQSEYHQGGLLANARNHHWAKNGTIPGFSYENVTTGWAQSCACAPAPPVPCTVLDPFVGSGTTVMVARQMMRQGIGVDLSREYLRLAIQRVQSVEPGVQLALLDDLLDSDDDAAPNLDLAPLPAAALPPPGVQSNLDLYEYEGVPSSPLP